MNREMSTSNKEALLHLLEVKDSDIRISILHQGLDAIDQGLHAGGAFSAVVPLVALFYGGFIDIDVEHPTRQGQDMFVLSKGHAVAALASIYADLGYFSRTLLKGSRSAASILNGHPGPILPGVSISTGPLGQGACVAEGFALAGKIGEPCNVFALLGDGELQEGIVWESIMFAPQQRLDNLCYIVDHNNGQLDRTDRLLFPMDNLPGQFESFGWRVIEVNAFEYSPVCNALETFLSAEKDGRPTAIICNTTKGAGMFSREYSGHKITVSRKSADIEIQFQQRRREVRERGYIACRDRFLRQNPEKQEEIEFMEHRMTYEVTTDIQPSHSVHILEPASPRSKTIRYDETILPHCDLSKEYGASSIIEQAMKSFAVDPRVVSIDADLGSTSGLQSGVGSIDLRRAINVGIAEANMMNIGEAFAVQGYNVWVSTFCPFFDLKVLRRIAVGQQERLEAMEGPHRWLSTGHGLDITFLATAPNFETKTNGATHMGNDDMGLISQFPQIRIIDIACPASLISVMRWIMEGDRGLIYLRIPRSPTGTLYGKDFTFAYGRGYYLKKCDQPQAVVISSGRGVYEALEAHALLQKESVEIDVIDMPSVDEDLFHKVAETDTMILFAEQNNGYLYNEFKRITYSITRPQGASTHALNGTDERGKPQFIHSGTYDELIESFSLGGSDIAVYIRNNL